MPAVESAAAVSVEKRFLQEFSDLPKDGQRKVTRAIELLRSGDSSNVKPLKGHDGVLRARAGEYRILFAQGSAWVHVYSVQHRQGVYANGIALPTIPPAAPAEVFPSLDEQTELDENAIVSDEVPYTTVDLRNLGLSDSQIDAIAIWDGTGESLEELVDLEIPDFLVMPLLERVSAIAPERRAVITRDIQLIRRDVLDSFFGPLMNLRSDHQIGQLEVISPWITPWDSTHSSLTGLCKFIRRTGTPTYVITRPPELKAHKEALEMLSAVKYVEITFLESLHAKYYVCDLAPSPRSLLASANSTRGSFLNNEVGVLVTGRGELEGYVRELQGLTTELRTLSNPA